MASENEILLLAVLKQIKVTRLDYPLLARDIGAPSVGAAAKRWQRFRSKLRTSAGGSPKKPAGVQKVVKSPGKVGNGRVMKQNMVRVKDEMEDEEDFGSFEEEPITPPRRMPPRKTRVTVFKDELTDDEAVEEGFDDAENRGELMDGGKLEETGSDSSYNV